MPWTLYGILMCCQSKTAYLVYSFFWHDSVVSHTDHSRFAYTLPPLEMGEGKDGVKTDVLLDRGVGMPPAVFVDEISERPASDWAKTPHGVANGENGIGMDAGWQTHSRFDLGLVEQVSSRQCGAQPQSPGCQQHVLHEM